MNARARNFLAANEMSPVVYFSQDDNLVTFRLANGKMFNMTALEAKQATAPLFAFQVLDRHRKEELALLEKVEAEASQVALGRLG